MKKAPSAQNNFMKRNFLPVLALFFFLLCASTLVFAVRENERSPFKKSVGEPVKELPAFLQELKDLFD
jgi:hypothetical protein